MRPSSITRWRRRQPSPLPRKGLPPPKEVEDVRRTESRTAYRSSNGTTEGVVGTIHPHGRGAQLPGARRNRVTEIAGRGRSDRDGFGYVPGRPDRAARRLKPVLGADRLPLALVGPRAVRVPKVLPVTSDPRSTLWAWRNRGFHRSNSLSRQTAAVS